MTSIVLTEFTENVNLRQFCVPREVFCRPIVATMLAFVCVDNPVSELFAPI
jgi:hypothetical protein